jgi:hypothetical protein
MIKQSWEISDTERNRIISLHELATKNFYVLYEQDSEEKPSESTDDISIERIIDYAKNLPYQEKIKLVFSIVPKEDFHNAKYREKIATLALGLSPKSSKSLHGPDLPDFSLKSAKLRANCKRNPITGKYPITGSQILLEFGRIDKEKTEDLKDTIVDIWGEKEPLLRVKIYADENFVNMYNKFKEEKREKMKDFKQTRDSALVKFKEVIDYNLKYEILYISDDVELKLKTVGCPID